MAKVHPNKDRLASVVESISGTKLLIAYVVVIFACGIIFYLLTLAGHGLRASDGQSNISFVDCLYFSVITISTVGYGDYNPIGFGRLLTVFEIAFGLFSLAFVIAKLSSYRQSQLLALMFSTQQRDRLESYCIDITEQTELLRSTYAARDPNGIKESFVVLKNTLGGVFRYISLLSKTDSVDSLYENTKLLGLLKVLANLAGVNGGISIISIEDEQHKKAIQTICDYLKNIASLLMQDSESDARTKKSASRLYSMVLKQLDQLDVDTMKKWKGTEKMLLSDNVFLDAVLEALPPEPYPSGMHVEVANKIGVSRTLANRAIGRLKELGKIHFDKRLPKEK